MTLATDTRLGKPDWADNWTEGGGGLRVEIIDTATRAVWLCHAPVTYKRARSLPLPKGFSLSGIAHAVADLAYFGRSPGADTEGALDTIEVDGLRFAFVARPVGFDTITHDGVDTSVMTIDKHHTMLYAASRTIEVLDFGDGTVATPAWQSPRPPTDRHERVLPAGWSVRDVVLDDDLIAAIPNPARVAVLSDGAGFHGPLPISQLEGVTS